jgi:nucleoside-specific outer membrane channel protein Tsx
VEKQLVELKGSDTVASDVFGVSVAVSGTTAVVGTAGTAYAGRAYVFTKTASGWKQTGELKGSDTTAQDAFGSAVAISGTTIVVGAYDHAKEAGRTYVFTRTGSAWKQVAELKGSDTVTGDDFGWSVAVSGTTVVVGAVAHAKYAGRAYVFAERAGLWTQVAELKGSDTVAKEGFGTSVGISGTTAIVGAEGHADGVGAAYVFDQSASGWTQVAELKGSGVVAGDDFGSSAAISGTNAIVGAPGSLGVGSSVGRAYVFTETSGSWTQAAELKGSDTTAGDFFGISAAISGSKAVVGAYDHAKEAGRAYVFTKTASGWKETAELKGSDIVTDDLFGVSVGISGTTALIGAEGRAGFAGRAYLFRA